MSEPLNPAQVEEEIRKVADRIAKGVRVCSERYEEFLRADLEYDIAVATVQDGFDGPEWRCKAAVTLETVEQRKARDRADVLYRYADRTAKALEAELRAYQSVGASVRAMYSAAGRGES